MGTYLYINGAKTLTSHDAKRGHKNNGIPFGHIVPVVGILYFALEKVV